jgi:hypothetical protein
MRITLREYLATMMAPRTMQDSAVSSFYLFGDNDYDDWTNFTEHYERLRTPVRKTRKQRKRRMVVVGEKE